MGGTFDPVHVGHLRVAEEAVELLQLDTLVFVPVACPPHKAGERILAFEHRWRMLELAIQDNPCFGLSDVERRLPGKSYTVNTLRKLREEADEGLDLHFLVGLDAFLEMDTWWHYRELFQLASLVVLRRPGYLEEQIGAFLKLKVSSLYSRCVTGPCFVHPTWLPVRHLENTPLGISSTQIRRLASDRRSLRYLVPPEVRSYIEREELYSLRYDDAVLPGPDPCRRMEAGEYAPKERVCGIGRDEGKRETGNRDDE